MARKSTIATPKAKSKASAATSETPEAAEIASGPKPNHKTLSDVDHTPEVGMATTPARKRKAGGDALPPPGSSSSTTATKKPKVALHTTQATLTSSASKKTQIRHSNVKVEIPVSTPVTGKRIVFDDNNVNNDNNDNDNNNNDDDDADGPGEFFTPQEGPGQDPLETQLSSKRSVSGEEVVADEDEEMEDSDDEAPEAVSTSTAAAHAARSAQAAVSAAERQQEEQKRKRQERDAKFKTQAEVRKKKQQQQQATIEAAEEEEEEAAAPVAAEAKPRQPEARLPGITMSTSNRKRLDKRNLPSMLPEEYLVSDSDGSDDEDLESSKEPSKIKFNTAARQVARSESRQPVDLRVGTTVYRVMKKAGDGKLAPKSGKYSKHAKELLLGRGRTAPRTGAGAKKRGFLVKR